ncbi:unnamed protein product [Echinostoma caproni]|uniref:Uncharacterized protein n=1 Tax=Echinostoma caproni TaxID=27848 RepID=A0A3P8H4F3_9TREM|nr:unnamed protein product [Echinostoma caproni]
MFTSVYRHLVRSWGGGHVGFIPLWSCGRRG